MARVAGVARVIGDETSLTLAEDLAEQIPREELNVLVVGQFKRGKSTLVNALLGADVMPTGALPITGIVTRVRYGEEPSIEAHLRRHAASRRVSIEELPLYVSEIYNPGNAVGVESIEIAWPSPRIRGFALFDTPGVGSTFARNTSAAKAALPRADAAIFVIGPEPPIGADELEYAREIRAASERMFVVLNKSDMAGDALPDVERFSLEALAELGPGVDLLSMSATRAREAQRTGDEDPAFARLTEMLREFAHRESSATRERSARRRISAVAQRMDVLLAMRRRALSLPRQERHRRRELVRAALQSLDDRLHVLSLLVDDDVRRLQAALQELLDDLHDRDRDSFCACAVELASQRAAPRRAARVEALVSERARAWQATTSERAGRELDADAAKYARLLADLELLAMRAGCEALQVDAQNLTPHDFSFAPAKLDLITSLEPSTGLELLAAFVADLLPAPIRQPILRRRYDRVLTNELDALRGKLRYGIAGELKRRQREVREALQGSVESINRSVLSTFDELSGFEDSSAESELARVEDLHHELASILEELGNTRVPA